MSTRPWHVGDFCESAGWDDSPMTERWRSVSERAAEHLQYTDVRTQGPRTPG
ncbi:hypothetical protein ACFFX0_04775 [Citricoccus parietis]|uniref:Uncharacterized protein n=1 Tax=Citricoccus parietis TaxID=592307 RepID=A0ABV5FV54_9MICC